MRYFLILALLCASLGQIAAQTDNREISRDTAYVRWVVTATDTAWFYTRDIQYADGSSLIDNVRTGDSLSAAIHAANQVLDPQRQYAVAIRTVANSVGLENRTTLISAMLETITGGTNYSQWVALNLGDRLLGSYTVSVSQQPSFVASLVRLSSGTVQLRRIENGVTTNYTVSVRSDLSFRVTNLPGASGNTVVAFTSLNSAGRPVYRSAARNVMLQRRGGPTFTTQSQ